MVALHLEVKLTEKFKEGTVLKKRGSQSHGYEQGGTLPFHRGTERWGSFSGKQR